MSGQEAWADRWPSRVRSCVEGVVGGARVTQVLSGMSGCQVQRVDGARGTVVVKGPGSVRELEFYRDVAPSLEGVSVPHLHQGYLAGGASWLVLEHVPHPLPTPQGSSAAAMYDALAAIHTSASVAFDKLSAPFLPGWTSEMTEQASATIGTDLGPWREEALEWITGSVPISGDANPRNWALRADGSLVLLDWERAGRGGAAVDVATTIPGLPSRAETESVAVGYLEARSQRGSPVIDVDFARGLQLAKLWTAVELLQMDRDIVELRETKKWLIAAVPRWLEAW